MIPNVEVKKKTIHKHKKTLCVLRYVRVVVLPYLVTPVENATGLGAQNLDGFHLVSVDPLLFHPALAPNC